MLLLTPFETFFFQFNRFGQDRLVLHDTWKNDKGKQNQYGTRDSKGNLRIYVDHRAVKDLERCHITKHLSDHLEGCGCTS
jgi:hypothetical protein